MKRRVSSPHVDAALERPPGFERRASSAGGHAAVFRPVRLSPAEIAQSNASDVPFGFERARPSSPDSRSLGS